MTTCLETVRKSDGERRYYIGGCRVTRAVYNSTGHSKECFKTIATPTHWRLYHERRL